MALSDEARELVEKVARETTISQVNKLAIWFGVTNGVFLLGSLAYVLFFLPGQAARQAEGRIDAVIAGSAGRLLEKSSEAFQDLGGVKERSRSIEENLSGLTQAMSKVDDEIKRIQGRLGDINEDKTNKVLVAIETLRKNPNVARALDVKGDLSSLQSRFDSVRLERTQCRWVAGGGFPTRASEIWVNGWDGPFNYVCREGEFLAGITSIHNNKHEDRAFDFVCCRIELKR